MLPAATANVAGHRGIFVCPTLSRQYIVSPMRACDRSSRAAATLAWCSIVGRPPIAVGMTRGSWVSTRRGAAGNGKTSAANLVSRWKSATFISLGRYPIFRRLWIAQLAYTLGQWMQSTALLWLAFELTSSERFVGYVAFAAGSPFILISIPGGALLDRFDRRRVLMAGQLVGAVSALVVALDVLTGAVEGWHLLIAAFLNGSLQAIVNPSLQALIPRLVEKVDLQNALGLVSAGANMTRVFGPALAGAMIGFLGRGIPFLIQAVAVIVAFIVVLATPLPMVRPALSRVSVTEAFSGVRLIRSRPDLLGLFLLTALPSFLIFPYISFLNVFAEESLGMGSSGYGAMMASSGVGAVIGGLLVAGTSRRTGIGRALLTRTLLYCGVIAVCMAAAQPLISMSSLVLAGFLGAFVFSANNATIQQRISDDVRGRVMGAYLLTFGLQPLGALWMGPLAQSIGIRTTTIIGTSVCAVAVALLALRSPALRSL